MSSNNRKLKAFVQYDGNGRVVLGGPIFRSSKPKVGNWKEISANQCCNPISYNFDVTADWSLTTPPVVDAASFKTFLEEGEDGDGNVNSFIDVVITDFNLTNGRLRCNLTANTGENEIYGLATMGVSQVLKIGNISGDFELYLYENSLTTFDPVVALPEGLTSLDLGSNQIVEFNPTLPLPSTLINLYLGENAIVNFNPSLPLPSGLIDLSLSNNQIVEFNPSIALPSNLIGLYLLRNNIVSFNPSIPLPETLQMLILSNNQMTTAGYTASETWANGMHDAPLGGVIQFDGNVDSVGGTNLETILDNKGWNVVAV